MSQMMETLNFLAAKNPIPGFNPKLPGPLSGPTGKILSWTAGVGLAMAVLGGLSGWACVAIGHNSERGGLAARGKQAVVWSLISGMGIGLTYSLVWTFFRLSQGKG
ncbi:hypothetical protein ACTWQF_35685 [Streptomyces sp. 8N114]|uniref:hypothetical protein n=1 Tax=Streptomyces sp. 8N114 TaxID=3457419 RepID=UPI003FD5F053